MLTFFFGVGVHAFTSNFLGSKHVSNDMEHTSESNNDVESLDKSNYLELENQLIMVENKIDANSTKLDYVLDEIAGLNFAEKESQNVFEEKLQSSTTRLENEIISNDEIDTLKSNIFSSLADSGTSLSQIYHSPEFNTLPQQEREDVLTEIVRQINNKEIDIQIE